MKVLFRGDVFNLLVGAVLVWFEPIFGGLLLALGAGVAIKNYWSDEDNQWGKP